MVLCAECALCGVLRMRLTRFECANVPMRECANVPMRECANAPMCQCANAPMRQCANAPMRQCANARMRECANVRCIKNEINHLHAWVPGRFLHQPAVNAAHATRYVSHRWPGVGADRIRASAQTGRPHQPLWCLANDLPTVRPAIQPAISPVTKGSITRSRKTLLALYSWRTGTY